MDCTGLREWLRRLREEIEAEPIARKLSEQTERLNAIEEELGEALSGTPSQAEVEALRKLVEEQNLRLQELIETMARSDATLTAELRTLQAQLESLSLRVAIMSKRDFVRQFMARVGAVATDPRVGNALTNAEKLTGVLQQAGRLLGGG